jgi:hypothetical protein
MLCGECSAVAVCALPIRHRFPRSLRLITPALRRRLDRLNDKSFRPLRKALGPIIEEQKSKFFEPPLPRQVATDQVRARELRR